MENILQEIANLKIQKANNQHARKLILLVVKTKVQLEDKPVYMYSCGRRKKLTTEADPLANLSMDQKISFYRSCRVVIVDDATGVATAYAKEKLSK